MLFLSKKYFLSLILFTLFLGVSFSQGNLKETVQNQISNDARIKDSILHKIKTLNNDTLIIDAYMQCFDLGVDFSEQQEYVNKIFGLVEKGIKNAKSNQQLRTALLNRKGQNYMLQYNIEHGKNKKNGKEHLIQARAIFKQTGNKLKSVETYLILAGHYSALGEWMNQYENLREGLTYAQEQKFNRGISRFYVQFQFFYSRFGDTLQTLEYIKKAIALEKKINDPTREARGYFLAGSTYRKLGKHNEAIKFLKMSIESYKKKDMQQKSDMGQPYLLLAEEYVAVGDLNSGLKTLEDLLDSSYKSNNLEYVFRGRNAKGRVLALMGKTSEAIKIHNELLSLVMQFEYGPSPLGAVNGEMAHDYFLAKKYPEARKTINLAIEYLNNAPVQDILEYEELAFKIDSSDNNYKGALTHYYRMNELKEKINKSQVIASAQRDQFNKELRESKEKQEKQKTIGEAEKKKQRFLTYVVLAGLVIALSFASLIFISLKKSKKKNVLIEQQKKEVEEKQKEIIDSITYAQRLQQAILPPLDLLQKNLKDYFIYYQPKDIVAGDFYWSEEINGKFYLAAADSTGHGVPGAMVSVVCSGALSRSVKEFGCVSTGEILDKTRELVIETFTKSNSDVKDGMDVSLICIDKSSNKIFWSGANNPLWYVVNGEMKEIKADKQPIGKTSNATPFTTHEIQYSGGGSFFLFTDGYADQFGGPKGKKFKYKTLSDLLLNNHNSSMNEQHAVLKNTFNNWKRELEQVDDICLLGLKL